MRAEQVADRIEQIYEELGDLHYGEGVTEREHGMQAAALAREAGEADTLVIASLLHDIGHLLHGLDEDIAERGVDGEHEEWSAKALEKWFGPEVSEPARLHVAAKRYLCTVDPGYEEGLSPASRLSLGLQGGKMSAEEVRVFEENRHRDEAIRLRRYDDLAKVSGLKVPSMSSYRETIVSLARRWLERS